MGKGLEDVISELIDQMKDRRVKRVTVKREGSQYVVSMAAERGSCLAESTEEPHEIDPRANL